MTTPINGRALDLGAEFDYRRIVTALGDELVHDDNVLRNCLGLIRAGHKVEEVLVETIRAQTLMKNAVLLNAVKLSKLKCPDLALHGEVEA